MCTPEAVWHPLALCQNGAKENLRTTGKVCKEENEKTKMYPYHLISVGYYFLLISKRAELDQCFIPDITLESPWKALKNALIRIKPALRWDTDISGYEKFPQMILMCGQSECIPRLDGL